jgi:uncharacterized protein (DUF2236 family)
MSFCRFIPAAALYGAASAPTSEADVERLFQATAGRLECSDIVFEFLAIMRSAPVSAAAAETRAAPAGTAFATRDLAYRAVWVEVIHRFLISRRR